MSEKLKGYIREWNEGIENGPVRDRDFKELYSIQDAIRVVYAAEKENLTAEEKAVVEAILSKPISEEF